MIKKAISHHYYVSSILHINTFIKHYISIRSRKLFKRDVSPRDKLNRFFDKPR